MADSGEPRKLSTFQGDVNRAAVPAAVGHGPVETAGEA